MAREIKKTELKPVDDAPLKAEDSILRLNPDESESLPQSVPARKAVSAPSARLEVQAREAAPARSHEPGIEQLIGTGVPSIPDEAAWGNSEKNKVPLPWGWFALIGLLLLGGAIWSLSSVNRAKGHIDSIRDQTTTLLGEEQAEESEAARTIERMGNVVREFHAARSIADLLPLVRHPERVEPLIRDHAERHGFPFGHAVEVISFDPLTMGNRANFWMVSVRSPSMPDSRVILETGPSGEVKVDWETAVKYQPMKWDTYALKRPGGSTMDFRVSVSPDSFFSHEFSNAGEWRSFRLSAHDAEEVLFGYSAVDSETTRYLDDYFRQRGPRDAAMILRLHLPEGLNSRRGVVIEKVLSSRWIYVEPPE